MWRFLALLAVSILLAGLAGCGEVSEMVSGSDGQGSGGDPQLEAVADTASRSELDIEANEAAIAEAAGDAADEKQIDQLLGSMSLDEKVGQILMPAFFGQSDDVSDETAAANLGAHGARTPSEIVALHNLGGVILLPENIESAEQVRELSRSIQGSAMATSSIPLLISVDQEGGRVSRLTDEVSQMPSAAELAGQVEATREASYVTGQQVRQQGINFVLAPVADVVSPGTPTFISDRSFGSDPEIVADSVVASIEGLQQSGVAAAAKHWPGHGATQVDSHERLPSVAVDRELWERREAVPFAAAIDNGVSAILVGHLALPSLEPSGEPATVSRNLIEVLLRDEFGFEGVIITDALNMGAVADYDQGELVVWAFQAGNDIILMPPSTDIAVAALKDALASGAVSEERLNQSVRRILQLKQRLGLLA